MKKILIASDHAGLPLKTFLINQLAPFTKEFSLVDLGTTSEASVDYPDFAQKLNSQLLAELKSDSSKNSGANLDVAGILICGSGQGMAMKANRNKGIRAAICWDLISAKLSREHNNANVLCMGARLIPFGYAFEITKMWLATAYAGGRHENRVKKLDQ